MGRRQKPFPERLKELVGELKMLSSDLQSLEQSNELHWMSSIAGRLHKLIIERRSNSPLLIDLALEKDYPLTVYVSNIVIADLRAEQDGRPKPYSSIVPAGILMPTFHPWYSTEMELQEALKIPCLVLGGSDYSFWDILVSVRDTEGQHSDPGRPELLDQLDSIEFPYGMTGSQQPLYHLAQVVLSVAGRFVNTVGGR